MTTGEPATRHDDHDCESELETRAEMERDARASCGWCRDPYCAGDHPEPEDFPVSYSDQPGVTG